MSHHLLGLEPYPSVLSQIQGGRGRRHGRRRVGEWEGFHALLDLKTVHKAFLVSFFHNMWSRKGRRIAPFIEHFPGSRHLVDFFIHITWHRSFNAWSPPGRLLGMFSSGASVRSKRKVSFLCSSKEGRHGTVLKWTWCEPLLSPQNRAEPSRASPGLCSFHIKLPCLAKQWPAWEGDLEDWKVRGSEFALNQMLTPSYFCSHFLREILKGEKDGQTTWLVLQLWIGTEMLSKRILK